jgi:hypothetical protein
MTYIIIHICCIALSTWVALSPRFRSGDTAKDWLTFGINLFAAALNAGFLLVLLFK